ncbi:hypothetical protein SLNSH_23990 [Alsobacter soli]|uniref:Uncharacterized protein n=1 Tax=Alsobacter soli TaxID=2109933 RepID=A0A2T1HLB8_9HYPH|nr:hypothetical protein SLNSH_23990 [Alsobacter soli]
MSTPAPPSSVSAPAPPARVSAPAPPVSMLAPASPVRRLAPLAAPRTFSMPIKMSPAASPPDWEVARPRSTVTPAAEVA